MPKLPQVTECEDTITRDLENVALTLQHAGSLDAEVMLWALKAAYEQGARKQPLDVKAALMAGWIEWDL